MDLEPLLSRPELRQLQQRVTRRFALAPLNKEEVQQYVEHRIALARQGEPAPAATNAGLIFKPDAIEAVAAISAGVPRVINLLCDRSLELAFDAQVHTIDGARVHAAARGLGIEKPDMTAAPVPAPAEPPAEPAAPPKIAAPEPVAIPGARPDPVAAAPTPAAFESADELAAEPLPAQPAATPRTTSSSPSRCWRLFWVRPAYLGTCGCEVRRRSRLRQRRLRPVRRRPRPSPAAHPAAQPGSAGAPPVPAAAAAAESRARDTRFDIIVASFRTDARATSGGRAGLGPRRGRPAARVRRLAAGDRRPVRVAGGRGRSAAADPCRGSHRGRKSRRRPVVMNVINDS